MTMTVTAAAMVPGVTPDLENRIPSAILQAEDNPTH